MTRSLPLEMLLMATVLAGCADLTQPPDDALYRVEVGDESFHVLLSDPAVIAGVEARLADGTWDGIVTGELARGDGGFNAPWSWHLLPETVVIADATIELCDGEPSMVEDDLDYWVDTVERFCPWGGQVVERLH